MTYVSAIGHISSFKLAVMEFFIRNLRLNFKRADQGQERNTKGLPQILLWRFGWIPLFEVSEKYCEILTPLRRWLFFVVVPLPSCVRLFATPWTTAHQASLALTISQSLPKFMSLHWWCHLAFHTYPVKLLVIWVSNFWRKPVVGKDRYFNCT